MTELTCLRQTSTLHMSPSDHVNARSCKMHTQARKLVAKLADSQHCSVSASLDTAGAIWQCRNPFEIRYIPSCKSLIGCVQTFQ